MKKVTQKEMVKMQREMQNECPHTYSQTTYEASTLSDVVYTVTRCSSCGKELSCIQSK